jgi:predicted RNase H-like HicB family nuclease
MKQIKVIIGRAKDGTFSAYAEKVNAGIWGMGNTVQEAKEEALENLRLFVENNDENHIPKELKGEYELVFKFDAESLLNYYKGIFTNSALERLSGINQRQLQHYATGLKKPRAAQNKKIEAALHKLGSELMAIEL